MGKSRNVNRHYKGDDRGRGRWIKNESQKTEGSDRGGDRGKIN